jgi:uncharacterized protein YcaQ
MRRLTIDQARRIALGAQGFATARPSGSPDRRSFRRVVDAIGLLQLDSVNVLVRSHYLPMLARLGPYDRDRLDRFTTDPQEMFEYWGHAASLLPTRTYPVWHFRRERLRVSPRAEEFERNNPGYLDSVYDEVAANGPITVSDLTDAGDRTGSWWGRGPGKQALEWLFAHGHITATRDAGFGRRYDLTERVIPRRHLESPAMTVEEAQRYLLLEAVRHLGVATAGDLLDYYRLHGPTARPVLRDLESEGALVVAEVPGWRDPVYLDPSVRLPRRVTGAALLTPFDPVVWHRDRTERLFDFHYRIEIYVPEPKRRFGYYVLPFLLDGELVGRVDLKADRQAGVLRVQAAHVEAGRDPLRVASAMAGELETMAGWLGLGDVAVVRRGDLAPTLASAIG